MRFTRTILAAVAAATIGAVLASAAVACPIHTAPARALTTTGTMATTAADLRVTLDQLFGEHAILAMNATNAGVTGAKSFPAAAKALDANSVALSKAVASLYGAKAGRTFLDGKFMWRDHIRFFVAYTVATAKHDAAAKQQAVASLKQYTVTFGDFLAAATGLPKLAVRNDLLGHVLELKDELDAYARGDYARAASLYHAAYGHMFMTGDLLASAIAKQKHLA